MLLSLSDAAMTRGRAPGSIRYGLISVPVTLVLRATPPVVRLSRAATRACISIELDHAVRCGRSVVDVEMVSDDRTVVTLRTVMGLDVVRLLGCMFVVCGIGAIPSSLSLTS